MRMYKYLLKSQKKRMHHSDNQRVTKYEDLVFLTKISIGIFAYIK